MAKTTKKKAGTKKNAAAKKPIVRRLLWAKITKLRSHRVDTTGFHHYQVDFDAKEIDHEGNYVDKKSVKVINKTVSISAVQAKKGDKLHLDYELELINSLHANTYLATKFLVTPEPMPDEKMEPDAPAPSEESDDEIIDNKKQEKMPRNIKGKITYLEEMDSKSEKWIKYACTLDDEDEYEFVAPADKDQPEEGDKIELTETDYGYRMVIPGRGGSNSGGRKKKSAGGRGRSRDRDRDDDRSGRKSDGGSSRRRSPSNDGGEVDTFTAGTVGNIIAHVAAAQIRDSGKINEDEIKDVLRLHEEETLAVSQFLKDNS